MTIDVPTSNVSHHSISAVTNRTNGDLALVNMQQASDEGKIMARTKPDTCSSQIISGSATASSPVPTTLSMSTANTDHQNKKSVSSRVTHLIKSALSKQMKVNLATLISMTLAVLAVVYTILSDNVGQKQLDLGMWAFCKSYSDDPQVQNSTTCQMYSQKTSLDELRRRDSARPPDSSVQILNSMPD